MNRIWWRLQRRGFPLEGIWCLHSNNCVCCCEQICGHCGAVGYKVVDRILASFTWCLPVEIHLYCILLSFNGKLFIVHFKLLNSILRTTLPILAVVHLAHSQYNSKKGKCSFQIQFVFPLEIGCCKICCYLSLLEKWILQNSSPICMCIWRWSSQQVNCITAHLKEILKYVNSFRNIGKSQQEDS